MQRHRPALTAVTLALLLGSFAAAAVAAKGWTLLGTRTVTDRLDHDSIAVTASRGEFTALQVRVQRRAVQFRSMTVHFANGGKQEVELRNVIPAGGSSRVIDLVGADRVITRVDFVYDAQALGGRRAVVRLYGRH